jgi:hypothetical protein
MIGGGHEGHDDGASPGGDASALAAQEMEQPVDALVDVQVYVLGMAVGGTHGPPFCLVALSS